MANEANLSTLSAILKEVYIAPIREQMIKLGVLFFRLNKTAEYVDFVGNKAVIPAMMGFSQAVGSRGERETLPTAKSTRYLRSEVGIKQNYGTIEVTGNVIRVSRNDKGAFTKAVDSELQNMVDGLKKDVNRIIYGNGGGQLAIVKSVAGQQITLYKNAVSPGSLHFEETMDLQAFAPDVNGYPNETAQHNGDFYVSLIDGVDKITVVGTITNLIDGDILVRKGTANREMNGLLAIVDDGARYDLLQNIKASEQRRWRATVLGNGGTLRALTTELIQQVYTAVEKQGSPSILVSSFEIRDQYAALLVKQKQFVNKLELDGGWLALEYNGKPYVADDQAHYYSLYVLDEKKLAFHQVGDFDWLAEDGLTLRKVPGVDSWEANLVYAANLATFRRNAASRLEDLKTFPGD